MATGDDNQIILPSFANSMNGITDSGTLADVDNMTTPPTASFEGNTLFTTFHNPYVITQLCNNRK